MSAAHRSTQGSLEGEHDLLVAGFWRSGGGATPSTSTAAPGPFSPRARPGGPPPPAALRLPDALAPLDDAPSASLSRDVKPVARHVSIAGVEDPRPIGAPAPPRAAISRDSVSGWSAFVATPSAAHSGAGGERSSRAASRSRRLSEAFAAVTSAEGGGAEPVRWSKAMSVVMFAARVSRQGGELLRSLTRSFSASYARSAPGDARATPSDVRAAPPPPASLSRSGSAVADAREAGGNGANQRGTWTGEPEEVDESVGPLRWAASDSLLEHTWCRQLRAKTDFALTRDDGGLRRDPTLDSIDAPSRGGQAEPFDGVDEAPVVAGRGGSGADAQPKRRRHSVGWVLAQQYLQALAAAGGLHRRGTLSLSSTLWGHGDASVRPETIDELLVTYERRLLWPSPPSCQIMSAFDPRLGEHVMIKLYHKRLLNERLLRRIATEARLAERLTHVHLVRTHCALDNVAGRAIVMELCSRGDLLREVALGAEASEHHVFLAFVRPVLLAVQYLHSQRVVHCDVTPGNVLLRGDGSACLGDLSNAVDLDADDGGDAGQRVGSLDYMPPEMLRLPTAEELRSGVDLSEHAHSIGPPVDVWQVGCLTFELLTGRAPFEFPDAEMTATAILFGTIDAWPSGLSERAKSFIGKCLVKDPDKRSTATELLSHAAIKAAAAATATEAKAIKGLSLARLLPKWWKWS